MKSNELRIGNYVKDPYSKTIRLVSVESSASMLTPIPLTEDWLVKFGFVKIGINYEKDWLLLHKNIRTQTVDFLLNEPHTGKYKATKLEHVHQLQNLYFALTGKELLITK